MFGRSDKDFELDKLEMKSRIELQKLDSSDSAKEVASKFIGKYGIMVVTLLVGFAIISAKFLDGSSLAVVIGLVSAVSTSIISMLMGITGTKDKESNPMADALQESMKQNNQLVMMLMGKDDNMNVDVSNGKVSVSSGSSVVTTDTSDEK